MAVAALDTPTPIDRDRAGWVDAAPFRAHVELLMAAGRMSPAVVAQLAGVSPRITEHLHGGRAGRGVRRISPHVARRLLAVTLADVRAVDFRAVPVEDTARRVRSLLAAGWTPAELGRVLGLEHSEVVAVAEEQVAVCTQRVALRAAAEAYDLLVRDDRRYRLARPLSAAA